MNTAQFNRQSTTSTLLELNNWEQPNQTNTASFDPRDHIDKLEPSHKREKDKYLCPVCGNHNLHINPNNGKYKCFGNNCKSKDIREAIKPLREWLEEQGQQPLFRSTPRITRKKQPSKPKPQLQAAPIPEKCQLLFLDQPATDIPQPKKVKKSLKGALRDATETIYSYSENKLVFRYDWADTTQPKGRDKTFKVCHIKPDNTTDWTKGDEYWKPYRFYEVVEHADEVEEGIASVIIWHEGEKGVELGRKNGMLSLTLQGSDFTEENITKALDIVHDEIPNAVHIFLADNDDPGRTKASNFFNVCKQLKLPCIPIDPSFFIDNPPDKADLEQILEVLTMEDIRQKLETILKMSSEVTQSIQHPEAELKINDIDQAEYEYLRQEVKALSEETDDIKKTIRYKKLYKLGYSKSDIDKAINNISFGDNISKALVVSARELLSMPTENVEWIIPGVLVSVGLTILGGDSGVGKTSFAYYIGGSVSNGEPCLNMELLKKGRTLYVNSKAEMLIHQMKKSFKRRGIEENTDVILRWDISQFNVLEEKVREFQPTLIVIDSFSGIHTDDNFDENSPHAAKICRKLQALSEKYSTSIILIHHANKNSESKGVNKLSGSTRIAAATTAVWILEGKDDSPYKNFSIPKIRGASNTKMELLLNADNGTFDVFKSSEDLSNKHTIDYVTAFMNINPTKKYTVEELVNGTGKSEASVRKALQRAEEDNEIIHTKCPSNHKVHLYSLHTLFSNPPLPNILQSEACLMTESIDNTTISVIGQSLDNVGQSLDKALITNTCLMTEAITTQASPSLDKKVPRVEGGGLKDDCPMSSTEKLKVKMQHSTTSNHVEEGADPVTELVVEPNNTNVSTSTLITPQTEGAELKAGDRVKYCGQDNISNQHYAGKLLIVTHLEYGKVTCMMPDGNYTSWLYTEELKRLNP